MLRRIQWGLPAALSAGLLLSAPAPAFAESVQIEPATRDASQQLSLPRRGEHRATVISRHGEPLRQLGPVGAGTRDRPYITRWDYDGFSVVFEGSLVLHSVVHEPNRPLAP
ncbi:hypothetical protein [Thioalkalivibrio paradoxus]|uniref:Uncharacterized protein n=1 Tax=Thioalkalivibrio paradoxus ARh 1 TaxID=713585 RepID=W0DLU3_9GAMM|nr:hypothetical protein [Thioalkalivibrio paradoxus]AHE98197.1 hypothetical protein THITH_07900 [Thioalkalivibrio paradoxus ARh 1]